ncbi:MAG: tRNA preQ1(34) S-adenosylmethionine ribosyltransferase-isomerase QueA, partial [Patescibacteria group bacterium]
SSRMLGLNRTSGRIEHHFSYELPLLLKPTDVLVFNNTKVFPARLIGTDKNGKEIELLLEKKLRGNTWQTIGKPGRRLTEGANLLFKKFSGKVISVNPDDGSRVIAFQLPHGKNLMSILEKEGDVPLPPYIHSDVPLKKYQTIYAKHTGSIAAPTAGFHFTPRLIGALKKKGIALEYVTLHVGRGTFQPVREDDITRHNMHTEWFNISSQTAARLNKYKAQGRRIIAVGTTTTRVLEAAARHGKIYPKSGETDIFIYPGYHFSFIDGMMTNFHLPKSTLIMLVSALAGRENVLHAYDIAIRNRYRFYSFGDAMLIA